MSRYFVKYRIDIVSKLKSWYRVITTYKHANTHPKNLCWLYPMLISCSTNNEIFHYSYTPITPSCDLRRPQRMQIVDGRRKS